MRFPSPSFNIPRHASIQSFNVLLDSCPLLDTSQKETSSPLALSTAASLVSVGVSGSPVCYHLAHPHILGKPGFCSPVLSPPCCHCTSDYPSLLIFTLPMSAGRSDLQQRCCPVGRRLLFCWSTKWKNLLARHGWYQCQHPFCLCSGCVQRGSWS